MGHHSRSCSITQAQHPISLEDALIRLRRIGWLISGQRDVTDHTLRKIISQFASDKTWRKLDTSEQVVALMQTVLTALENQQSNLASLVIFPHGKQNGEASLTSHLRLLPVAMRFAVVLLSVEEFAPAFAEKISGKPSVALQALCDDGLQWLEHHL